MKRCLGLVAVALITSIVVTACRKNDDTNTNGKENAVRIVNKDAGAPQQEGPTDANLEKLADRISLAEIEAIRSKSPLPKEDWNREFGKHAFTVITDVDKKDPSVFLLEGVVGIKSGKITSSMPGAVFVVGVPDSIIAGSKTFSSRQIILLTSKPEYILAPPGITITIPGDVEVFGKTYKAGKFKVPKDSKFPDTL